LQARTRHFRDLIAWQKAMALTKAVYRLTESFPRAEQFGLTSQMRRSAVSAPSNIAEGHGRLTDGSFRVFLAQARGSLYELETQIELAVDLGLCEPEAAEKVLNDCFEVARILNGLLRSLRRPSTPDADTTAQALPSAERTPAHQSRTGPNRHGSR
jgi:four helix bundle protein